MKSLWLSTLSLVVFVMVGVSGAAAQQQCNSSLWQATPDVVFTLHDNGTVTHKVTGLMWMRCSLGQTWDGAGCAASATLLSWSGALTAATAEDFAGYRDWRLPNKNELESLVEQACVVPSINEKVFPATPSLFYWTASPYAGSPQGAWSIDFGYGAVSATVKTANLPARLVRDVVW